MFFGPLPFACSIRLAARSILFVIVGGTASVPHVPERKAASSVQRAVTQISVEVVVDDELVELVEDVEVLDVIEDMLVLVDVLLLDVVVVVVEQPGTCASGGHAELVPVHVSATSHESVAGRHTVEAS